MGTRKQGPPKRALWLLKPANCFTDQVKKVPSADGTSIILVVMYNSGQIQINVQ